MRLVLDTTILSFNYFILTVLFYLLYQSLNTAILLLCFF